MKDYSNVSFPKRATYKENKSATYGSHNFPNGEKISYVQEADHSANALGYRWYVSERTGRWGLVHYTELK